MQRLSLETQTLYAELSERLRAFEAARSFASLAGAFAKKQVRGADYWYLPGVNYPDLSASIILSGAIGRKSPVKSFWICPVS